MLKINCHLRNLPRFYLLRLKRSRNLDSGCNQSDKVANESVEYGLGTLRNRAVACAELSFLVEFVISVFYLLIVKIDVVRDELVLRIYLIDVNYYSAIAVLISDENIIILLNIK